jgi:hypothetical protein
MMSPYFPDSGMEIRTCTSAVYRIHRVWLMEAFYKHMVDLLASIDDCASKESAVAMPDPPVFGNRCDGVVGRIAERV